MRRDRQEYRQNGFILIVVLGAVLMLSALLYGFNQATRTSLDKADGFCSAEQVWNSAWAGLQIAVEEPELRARLWKTARRREYIPCW